MNRDLPRKRSDYWYFDTMDTRWNDNDVYGHMNNAIYYELFDSVINRYLIEHGSLDIRSGKIAGIIPETRCKYRKPVRFPDRLDVGLKVTRLGSSSVVYDSAIFRTEDDDASAECHFVHVFVSRRKQGKTVKIPSTLRTALTKLVDYTI
jgi:acyl-CoA thioester hydrolase